MSAGCLTPVERRAAGRSTAGGSTVNSTSLRGKAQRVSSREEEASETRVACFYTSCNTHEHVYMGLVQ